jgi:hypothetical protein
LILGDDADLILGNGVGLILGDDFLQLLSLLLAQSGQ